MSEKAVITLPPNLEKLCTAVRHKLARLPDATLAKLFRENVSEVLNGMVTMADKLEIPAGVDPASAEQLTAAHTKARQAEESRLQSFAQQQYAMLSMAESE